MPLHACLSDIIFHGSLRDLLPPCRRTPVISYPVLRRASIKDVIESLGPPHTEVGKILLEGTQRDFQVLLEPGQRLEVFPVTVPWDVTRSTLLRPHPLARLNFLVDENIHRLAELLRMVGLDAAAPRELADESFARLAAEEGRVLLSRDTFLLKRKTVVFGRLVRSAQPWEQLREIVDLFGLHDRLVPFSRCIHCNVPLVPRTKEDVLDLLEPLTRKYYQDFHACPACGRVYWAGSHHQRMLERLQHLKIMQSSRQPSSASDTARGPSEN